MTNQAFGSRPSPIRVLVVDDQKMMRSIFKEYANSADDILVVGSANNGKEGVERVIELEPDVVLMDVEMPDMDGIAATRMLQNRKSRAKVLIVSTSYDDRYLAQALRNGASGYLLKTTSPEDLISAIRGVHEGSLQFGSGVLQRELSSLAPGGILSEPDRKVKMPNTGMVQEGAKGTRPPREKAVIPAHLSKANSVKNVTVKSISSRGPSQSSASTSVPKSPAARIASQSQTVSRGARELETELSRIRAAYWVLKTEQNKVRRWLNTISFIGAGALAVLFILVCLAVV